MEKVLSIIVPSYNMEDYLAKGLESVLDISDPSVLDVIVVNDGSKDRTLEITRDFEHRYPGIVTVVDKENGNYGSCINVALKKARGKYVRILDADDYMETAAFEAFVNILGTIDADVVVNDYQKVYVNGKKKDFTYSFPAGQTMVIADMYNEASFSTLLLPALTYRHEILMRMGYHQTEGISYTDMEWCYSPMTQMSTLFYFNRTIYMYVMGREGQTMDPVVYRKRMPQLFQCLHSLMNSLDTLTLLPWAKRFANEQLCKHSLVMYRFYLVDNPKESRNLLVDFDTALKEKNKKVYELCGKCEYRKKIPYYFVNEWRNGRHDYIPKVVRFEEIIYDVLGTIHYYLLKIFNPNLKR